MFRQMRRYKQKLSEKECINLLIKQPRGVLAVLGDNEYPYTIPINYVYDDGKIFFHGAKEGHKIDSLKNNAKVSFNVIDEGYKENGNWWYVFNSVVVFGKINFVEEPNKVVEKLKLFGNKYFPSDEYTENEIEKYKENTQILELEIEHVSGKKVTEK